MHFLKHWKDEHHCMNSGYLRPTPGGGVASTLSANCFIWSKQVFFLLVHVLENVTKALELYLSYEKEDSIM